MAEIGEQLRDMQRQIDALRRELETLRPKPPAAGFTLEEIEYFENLPASAVVGKNYVAWRFGVSVRAVLRGEGGTNSIPRVSNSPLKFIKSAVDAAWKKRRKKPVEQRAAIERKKAKKRIYSIVKNNSQPNDKASD